jgi:hypothetical protein
MKPTGWLVQVDCDKAKAAFEEAKELQPITVEHDPLPTDDTHALPDDLHAIVRGMPLPDSDLLAIAGELMAQQVDIVHSALG